MEIISVIRGDHPSDLWRLSPFTKGILPFNPLDAQMHRWFLVSISAAKLIKKWPKTKYSDNFFTFFHYPKTSYSLKIIIVG